MRIDRGLTAVAAATLAGAAVLAVLVGVDPVDPPLLDPVDRAWRAIVQPPPGWAHVLSEAFWVAGLGAVTIPLRIAVAGWLAWRRRWPELAAWLLAWAAADLLTQLLKSGLGRMRPDGSAATSFPSGHTKSAAQIAIGLALVAGRGVVRPAVWGAAVAVTVTMGVSRTILDHHWLSDAVGGGLLGAGCAVGAWVVVQLRAR
jgi:undecaprenyl-diphosphatase